MPYLADLLDLCGDVFEPAFCLTGGFLLIAFGVWSAMAIACNRNRPQAWISCFPRDGACLTPATARRKAPLEPRFRLI
jgi:hypothetical protein